jgi:hypothetical protein
MTYVVREIETGFIIVGSQGALLRDGGAGMNGEPLVWRERARAEAKAEWMNRVVASALMTRSERRTLRNEIATKHGISADTARGLLN